MHFNINSTVLSSNLTTVGRAITSRSSMPMMENFFFHLQPECLSITASDSEIFIRTSLPLEYEQGRYYIFMLYSNTLLTALKEIPDCMIRFELDDKTCTVRYTNGSFTLPLLNNNDTYPEPEKFNEDDSNIEMDFTMLNDVCNTLPPFVNDDTLRPIMSTLHFNIMVDKIDFVATNGSSLALLRAEDKPKGPFTGTFNISLKTASILSSIMKRKDQSKEEVITIRSNGTNAEFTIGSYTVTSRLIEGRFPNYNAVWPKDNVYSLLTDSASLIAAIRRCRVFSDSNSKIILEIREGSITVKAQNMDSFQSSEEKIYSSYKGVDFIVAFNGEMLSSILKNLDKGTAILEFKGATTPFIIHSDYQEKCCSHEFLLMPMVI